MELYFWGANSHLQSGRHDKTEEQFEIPILIDFHEPEAIIQICGGGGHTVTLKNDGKVFSCGWNNKGQLGVSGVPNDSATFVPILLDTKIRRISCGWDVTSLISFKNDFFVCGNNQYEQLGIRDPKIIDTPFKVPLPKNIEIMDVSFGLRHTSILTKTGKVLLFGQSKCLRIAENMTHKNLTLRKFDHNDVKYLEMDFTSNITSIASGQYYTLAYARPDHRLFMIGENKHTNFSNQEIDVSSMTFFHEISAGWTHFVFLDETGNVHSFGRNNYHQLGREEHEGQVNIQEKVKKICCGSEHTAVLTESGKVMTWGWNEHGNCGLNGVEDVSMPSQVKLSGRCLMIGTGCGFCFALIQR